MLIKSTSSSSSSSYSASSSSSSSSSSSNGYINDVKLNDNGEVILKRREYSNTKYLYYLFTEFFQNTTVYLYVMTFLFSGLFCLFLLFIISYIIMNNLLIMLLNTFNIYIINNYKLSIININSINELQYLMIIIIIITLFILYIIYWLWDWDSENHGGHPKQFIRYLKLWEYLADYFPIHLVISKEFIKFNKIHNYHINYHSYLMNSIINNKNDNHFNNELINENLSMDVNYLVGFHPHGILATGAFINFATEATGFSKVFPKFKPYLAILKTHFIAPFYRDFLMLFGMIAATKKGLYYLLDKNSCKQTGNFVVVVLGGASEALDSRPGTYVMHINQRFGFFKLALQTGSYLVPCISFGEQSLYHQVPNEKGSWIRWLQDKFTSISTVALPIFYARGPFPYRKPVYTVGMLIITLKSCSFLLL
ncbi:unnamed protein product [Schistosoma margrebowiei]|uniref:Acyltransferase n=1 Tax=Schistosoma margrebowiei TaxID=48269 RepID=A0AA84ZLZ7_9TREM|nr:unnamed protein product [Schistosoma margrebowiei]